MNDDELRRLIASADPMAPDVAVPTSDTDGARALLEDIMKTTEETDIRSTPAGGSGRPRWMVPLGAVAAAALLVVGLAAGGVFGGSDAEDDTVATDGPGVEDGGGEADDGDGGDGAEPGTVLDLSLGEGQDIMASCMVLDPAILAEVPLAFAGDVTAIDGEVVTLEVTEWYVGGDADSVRLDAPIGLEALIGTVEFEVGGSFLISSGDGTTVNYCGYSGPATPELQAAYDAAFGA